MQHLTGFLMELVNFWQNLFIHRSEDETESVEIIIVF